MRPALLESGGVGALIGLVLGAEVDGAIGLREAVSGVLAALAVGVLLARALRAHRRVRGVVVVRGEDPAAAQD